MLAVDFALPVLQHFGAGKPRDAGNFGGGNPAIWRYCCAADAAAGDNRSGRCQSFGFGGFEPEYSIARGCLCGDATPDGYFNLGSGKLPPAPEGGATAARPLLPAANILRLQWNGCVAFRRAPPLTKATAAEMPLANCHKQCARFNLIVLVCVGPAVPALPNGMLFRN